LKGLRNTLRVSWIAKKTNEWVLNKAGVKRELLDTVKARKLAYHGHTIRKQGSCLEKEIMQGTMPGARRRRRPRTAWMANVNTWKRLPVEWKSQSERQRTEIKGESTSMVWPTLGSRTAKITHQNEPGSTLSGYNDKTSLSVLIIVSLELREYADGTTRQTDVRQTVTIRLERDMASITNALQLGQTAKVYNLVSRSQSVSGLVK